MKKIIFTLLLLFTTVFSQEIYLYTLEYPKNIYTNQTFKVKIKAIIVTEEYDSIKTNFTHTGLEVLNPYSPWIATEKKNEFINTFIFKANDQDFIFPTISIDLLDEYEEVITSKKLSPLNINFNNIALEDKLFSKVIAKDLSVLDQVTKQYDNNFLLTILHIKAQESNLEDFELPLIQRQGLEDILVGDDEKELYYYIIVPRDDETIRFKYYNHQTKIFQTIIVPIELSSELVSTQTDLNPQNSKLLFYQKVLLSVLTVLFIILYLIYKRKIALAFTFVSLAILVVLFLPHKKISIDAGTKVYILPLSSSTIFETITSQQEVEYLKTKNGFDKIILPNQKIGWIKQ